MNRAQRRLAAPHVRTKRVIDPSRISSQGSGLNAHFLVAKKAVELALDYHEVYMASNNELWHAFDDLTEEERLTAWCARIAPLFLEEARLRLTEMLSQPDILVPKAQKDEIAEALILDNTMRANRGKAADHMPSGLVH